MGYIAWAVLRRRHRGSSSPTLARRDGPAAEPRRPGQSPAPTDEYVVDPVATPATTASRINILLTGVDSAEDRTHALTDTLLVASIDPTTADVALVSIPRDISDFPLYDGRTFTGKINSLMT